ncbi:PD-(D/E)XK nuclease family protein [Aurantibacter crassamenti]|uniref:PD-(D/E)XK nuclease family protein n=1 Tax=Aurantibacter crassamenti TaxID=1837375 RepID=UPI0019395BB8|nr:PD-(D/E)XK nuclease family protein [Aurantibacter crassamenti]MBM1105177.1 PD-(D/E)XK nuclease family protein [Aurantibacter crassamenti]
MSEIYIKIDKVAKQLPELPRKRNKNLFDILGIDRRETINSKLVAYFFNSKEEHGFGTLFFDSLIQLIDEKNYPGVNVDVYKGDFSVLIEEVTRNAPLLENRQKRIDIILKAKSWSVLIENKLYHHVNNPFEVYINHAKQSTGNILGIILSLDTQTTLEFENGKYKFISITHQQLINRVQENLILSHVENDTNIFYLREYIKTINSHYKNKMDKPQLDKLLNSLIEQKEAVSEIVSKRLKAISFIEDTIKEVFAERGYKYINDWYCHPSNPNLCFCVNSGVEIIEKNKIGIAFVLFNELLNTEGLISLKEIHTKLKQLKSPPFYLDDSHDKSNAKRIITYREKDFLNTGIDLKTKLSGILDVFYFNPGGIESIVLNQLPKNLNLKSASEYQD